MEAKEYSALFSKVSFSSPLSESLKAVVARCSGDPTSLRNVYPIRSARSDRWVVKYYIARLQYTFGIFARADLETAMRLADMVILKFKPHRQRDAQRALYDEDFNLTPAQAKFDIENEPEINSLLLHFFAALPDADLRAHAAHKKGSATLAAIKALADHLTQIDQRLQAIERTIDRRSLIPADYRNPAFPPYTVVYEPTCPVKFYPATDPNIMPGTGTIGDPVPAPSIGDRVSDPLPPSPFFISDSGCGNAGDGGNVGQ